MLFAFGQKAHARQPSREARLDYPIQLLARAGIARIMVITGPESAGDFIAS